MRSVIRDAIAGDATLSALATGGVHIEEEISETLTPAAYDAFGELKPCLLVKLGTDIPDGPADFASRLMVDIYQYQRQGYDIIDQMPKELRRLFHRQKVGAAADGVWEMRWIVGINNQTDPIGSFNLSRYVIVRHIG